MYDKFKLMMEIGKLEFRFEKDPLVLKELSNFCDKARGDDILQTAIAFGRLQAKIGEADKGLQEILTILTSPKPSSDMSIDELEFTTRTYNCLNHSGIKTVEQITKVSSREWTSIRNLGRQSYDEIAIKMRGLGLEIAPYGNSK